MSEAEYGHLLRIGLSSGPDFYVDDEELLLRLAEPWFDAIRARAERDGLRIECYIGSDPYTQVRGASAALLRPDGSLYSGWHKPKEHEAMMLADWGEVLMLARSKHKETMPDYWDEERRIAERQKQEAEHAAMMAKILSCSDLPEIFASISGTRPRRWWLRFRRDRSEQ